MYALVDCNNFYASCERVFRPNLNGKPIVVLSNNDGCVIARSNEAKLLNIPMGAPAFKFKEEFKKHNISVFSSNYALYGDMSARVMSVLSNYTPEIEIYSIDEAFLKLEGFEYFNIDEYGKEIVKTVTKSTGIPVCIGIAPTKTLTKVANRIAKKFPNKTGGVYIIDSDEKRIKALKWLAIEDVWGIGRKLSKKLKQQGIVNAYQFINMPNDWVRKQMSVVGLRLKKELEGNPTNDLEKLKTKKVITTTRTFDKNCTNYNQIKERVATYTISCAEKLRKQKTNCNSLLVFVETNRHRHDLPQYKKEVIIKLPYPTNSNIELVKFALKGLRTIFNNKYSYKRAGVMVMDLTPEHIVQLNLFENSIPKHKPLMQTIDKINRSFGQHTVKLGSQDLSKKWKMKQENLSPKYTTNINDIIVVNA